LCVIYYKTWKITKNGIPGGGRRRGKQQRKRWLDDVGDDLWKIGVKCWRKKAMDTIEWKIERGGQASSRAVEPCGRLTTL
jgi:hypothetical protein